MDSKNGGCIKDMLKGYDDIYTSLLLLKEN